MAHIHWSWILILLCQNIHGICVESWVRSQASPPKMCWHADINVILGTWDHVWSYKPQLSRSQRWGSDWPDWPRVTWDSCVNRPLVVFWGLSSTHFYLALVSSKVHIHWLSKTNQSTKQQILGRHVCCRLEFAQHRQDRHVHDWYRVILVITYKQLI